VQLTTCVHLQPEFKRREAITTTSRHAAALYTEMPSLSCNTLHGDLMLFRRLPSSEM